MVSLSVLYFVISLISLFRLFLFAMPSKSKHSSDASHKDLQALKKSDLIRLILDLRKSISSVPVDKSSGPLSGSHSGDISLQQSSVEDGPVGHSSPALSGSCSDSSAFMAQIKSAVTDAIKDLKSELRLEYQSALADQELRFSKEVLALREEINCLKNKIEQASKDIETDVLRDLRDAEYRKKNLILFGIPECVSSVPSERKESDFRAVQLLSSALGVKDIHFKNAFRLGKPRDRPRPIKLIGLSYQQREELLGLSFRIPRLNPALGFCKVFIKADLSLKEQAIERGLRREIDTRRNAGENVFLRGGKIVSRVEVPDASRSLDGGRRTD